MTNVVYIIYEFLLEKCISVLHFLAHYVVSNSCLTQIVRIIKLLLCKQSSPHKHWHIYNDKDTWILTMLCQLCL